MIMHGKVSLHLKIMASFASPLLMVYLTYKLNGPYQLRPFQLAARNQHKYRIRTELYHVSWGINFSKIFP